MTGKRSFGVLVYDCCGHRRLRDPRKEIMPQKGAAFAAGKGFVV
jgi:hypothetical protein